MTVVSGLTAGLMAAPITRTDGRTDLRRNTYNTAESFPSVPRARIPTIHTSESPAALRASQDGGRR